MRIWNSVCYFRLRSLAFFRRTLTDALAAFLAISLRCSAVSRFALIINRTLTLVEQCPFKSLLCNAPTADQSLTSGFPHNKRGKGLVVGTHCALNCALSRLGRCQVSLKQDEARLFHS